MPTLAPLIAAALVRLGRREAAETGWIPRSPTVKSALDALGGDDVDRAIETLARAWDEAPGEETEVAREVILIHLAAAAERIDLREAEAKKFRAVAEGEITLLDLRLRRLRFRFRPLQAWVALAAGAAVVGSSAVAVLRFDLHPAIAGIGLLAFAAGAFLLVSVDRRRQRGAFEAYRAQVGAEVAEETQILRQEVRVRDGEIRADRAERERILAQRSRLPGFPRLPALPGEDSH